MVVMAAADENELIHMTATAAAYNKGPIALRYPRGNGNGLEAPLEAEIITIGKGRIIKEGRGDVALLSLGTRLFECEKAAEILESQHGLSVTIADARFAKPLDSNMIKQLLQQNKAVITIEEGSVGGFGSIVSEFAVNNNLTKDTSIFAMHLPDSYQDHSTPHDQYEHAELNAGSIITKAIELLGR